MNRLTAQLRGAGGPPKNEPYNANDEDNDRGNEPHVKGPGLFAILNAATSGKSIHDKPGNKF